MAFVDVTQASLYGNGGVAVGGAPSGGGNVRAAVNVGAGVAPGSNGPGTNAQVRHWVLGFYLLIAVILVSAGVIFNGKG